MAAGGGAKAPVKVGLIGVGGISPRHVRAFLETGLADITAITDPDKSRIARTRSSFPALDKATVFGDHTELLEKADIDAVEINSPHCFHCPQIVESLEAGKHVLTEKPMANSIEEARKVLGAWKKSGLVFSIAYQRQFSGMFRYMRDAISRGEIGEVLQVSSFLTQGWYEGTTGTWRQKPEMSGGGQLNDSGSHIVNMMTWVPGMRAAEVSCYQEFFDREVDINSTINVKFDGGALGAIFIAGRAPVFWEDFSAVGAEGALFLRRGKVTQIQKRPYVEKIIENVKDHSSPGRNFIEAILGRAELVVSPIDGLRVIELTEAAWESAEQGGAPVKVKRVDI